MFCRLSCALGFAIAFAVRVSFAQSARDTVVEVSATVQESPPQITLSWLPASQAVTGQTVYRRIKGEAFWKEVAAPAGSTYVDSSVQEGVNYEYFVRVLLASSPGFAVGYLSAGIRLPLAGSRGRVLLLVEETVAASLSSELERFTQDLIGDGWVVRRHGVSRSDTVAGVKATIAALDGEDPTGARALILFGRIPVPYSGELNPDGHPEHLGAWPADVFYGDLDGLWTDVSVDNAAASRPENRNVPGDGKFDQSAVPSDIELEVGRIDLSNMPGDEIDLLRQYLDRDHAFRHKTGAFAQIVRRGLIDDAFGYFGGEAFAATAWRNFTSFFGSATGSVNAQDWFGTLQTNTYLWAYGAGPGGYASAGGIGGSGDFRTKNSLAVFNILFGSYFGDWDNWDNFLRAPLASSSGSLGLVSLWAGRPHWHLYSMAMGETVGYGARVTQNNAGFIDTSYLANYGARGVHIALMGDPTLRLHPVTPVADLIIDSSSGLPVLSWTASPETDLEGYRILRASNPDGPYISLGGSLTAATSYVDRTGVPGQSYHYMVQAIKVETSAGGTYLNNSQGVFGSGSFAGPVETEMNLTGNGQVIPSGAGMPSVGNGTAFGEVEINRETVMHLFTIANEGTSPLTLNGTPVVQISGDAAGEFHAQALPAAEIAGGTSVMFEITFAPTTTGLRVATVTIANDDSDENPYEFTVSGTGLPPSPEVAVSPASIGWTVARGSADVASLTISNTGAGPLDYAISSSQSDYSFRDSNSFGGPCYAWIEISGTGAEVTGFANPDDALSGPISLGFAFPFFEEMFDSVLVSTNGFIAFGDPSASPLNTRLPSLAAPGNMIAAFWDDLILDGNSGIFTQQIGDVFVVQFDDLWLFDKPEQRITCEIVLRSSGEILLQYKTVTETDHGYTVGIQNGQQSHGLQIAVNADYVQESSAIRIVPPGLDSWLSLSSDGGTVAPGGSRSIDASLISLGLSPGFYSATVTLDSNDADEARLTLPVMLTISGPEVETLGNGLAIPSGDGSPLEVDHTDFGGVSISGGIVSRTFTIRNTGSDPLSIGPVSVAGAGFSVASQPAPLVNALGSSTFVVSFAPANVGAAFGTLRFATNDADEALYEFSVIGAGLTPIEAWRFAHFGTTANAGDAADYADPDWDDISNLLEYAFALEPLAPGAAGLPAASVNPDGYLQVQFTRNGAATDVTYDVQVSPDLLGWATIASSVGGGVTVASGAHSVVESGVGILKTVVVEDSQIGEFARFIRVRVTPN